MITQTLEHHIRMEAESDEFYSKATLFIITQNSIQEGLATNNTPPKCARRKILLGILLLIFSCECFFGKFSTLMFFLTHIFNVLFNPYRTLTKVLNP